MMAPRADLMELFAELDNAVDAFAWNTLLAGGHVPAELVRMFRSQARLDLLNELSIQRTLDAVGPIADRPPRRGPAKALPPRRPAPPY